MVWAAARRLHAALRMSIAFGSSAGRAGVAGGGGVCAFPTPATTPHPRSSVQKLHRHRVLQVTSGLFIRKRPEIRLGENPRFNFGTASDPFRMADGGAPTQGAQIGRASC